MWVHWDPGNSPNISSILTENGPHGLPPSSPRCASITFHRLRGDYVWIPKQWRSEFQGGQFIIVYLWWPPADIVKGQLVGVTELFLVGVTASQETCLECCHRTYSARVMTRPKPFRFEVMEKLKSFLWTLQLHRPFVTWPEGHCISLGKL